MGRCWGQRFREGWTSQMFLKGRWGRTRWAESGGFGPGHRQDEEEPSEGFVSPNMRPSSPKASNEGHCGGLRGRDPVSRQSLRASWCRREREGWVTPGAEPSSRHWSAWLPGPVARRSQSRAWQPGNLAGDANGRHWVQRPVARRPPGTTEWVAEMRQSIGPWRWAEAGSDIGDQGLVPLLPLP